MSTPTPSSNSFQRVAVAAGVVIVVILTVAIAFFLAAQEIEPPATATVAMASPTASPTNTPTISLPSPTFTSLPADLPSATPTPSATPAPEVSTPTAAANTNTPAPPTATATSTPQVIVITSTPLPSATPATPGVCQPPPDWKLYLVQPGDTLDSLANRTNSSVYELQQVNCLDSIRLQQEQEIYLPMIPPTPTETRTPGPTPKAPAASTITPTPIKPVIDNVVPDRVDENTAQQGVTITVLGRNFRPNSAGFKVELRGPQNVLLQLGEAKSDTSFDAIVPSGLPEGTYDVVVTNPNSDRAGVKESAYIIGPAPTPSSTPLPPRITNFSPKSGKISDEVLLTITGTNFQPNHSNFEVKLQRGGDNFLLDRGNNLTSTSFEAIIRSEQLPEAGIYSLVVTNPDGQSDIADDEYKAEE